MSSGRAPRAPIPLPGHITQSGPSPPVPAHGTHAAVRSHQGPPAAAVTVENRHRPQEADDHHTPHNAARNVYFSQHAELHEQHNGNQADPEVAVELDNLALGETADSDGESSGRSEISHAPSVEHYNISFEFKKTFREHNGARTMKAYHKILKLVYNQSLYWSYNILLFALGLFVTVLWALINALVAFLQTWGISPLTRVSLVIVRGLLPIIMEPLGLLFKTCATACGCGAGCLNFGGAFQRPGRHFIA